ncbi:hypothetical protein DV737_g3812, partial [Chaetothyriales sp. CBS 132003]
MGRTRTPDYAISELEYQSLPPVLRRKRALGVKPKPDRLFRLAGSAYAMADFFSSLERLRLEKDGGRGGPCRTASCGGRRQIVGARATSVFTEVFALSSTFRPGLHARGLTSADRRLNHDTAAWFASLPAAVRRKQFSREEQIIFAGARRCLVVDAADEAVDRRCHHHYRPSAAVHTGLLGGRTSGRRLQDDHFYFCFDSSDAGGSDGRDLDDIDDVDDIETVAWSVDSMGSMANYSIGSFCFLEDESELDLKLDDYHQAVQETAASQMVTQARPRATRNLSLSSMSHRQSSLSSQTMAPSSRSYTSSMLLKSPPSPTCALRSAGPAYGTRPSTASVDRQATFYQDPAARMQLRLYLASPSKFDEAIEFGFPSLPDAPDTGVSSAVPSAATGLADELDKWNDAFTPEDADFRRESSRLARLQTPSKARVAGQSHAQLRPLEREMTIHMTLTRPDLRSPEEMERLGVNARPIERAVLPPCDMGGSVWEQQRHEKSRMRRMWNKLRKDGPTLSRTTFDNALDNVFYFDDSDVILGLDKETGNVWRSTDAGATWAAVDGEGQQDRAWDLWPHPYDKHRAYIIGAGSDHWVTTDRGQTWRSFNPKFGPDLFRALPLSFHGRDPKKVIWNAVDCTGQGCRREAYYTDDDFETIHLLKQASRGCSWAVATPQFAEHMGGGGDDAVDSRVFCVVAGLYSSSPKDYRLLASDDYFDQHEVEPALHDGRAVPGIISMAAVKSYIVAAAKSEGTDELALFVTADASQWHRCEFGQHRIEEDAYTILESTNYSMQVDVLGSKRSNPVGYLFTSNSNGTYFTRNIDHTNRNEHGRVDFEKISNIQGIVLVNVVDNWAEVENSAAAQKQVQSRISFDDGRTFDQLRVKDQQLHLHSVTDARQGGRLFSSPAPGLVMGVGNVGKFLRPYEDGDTYVSDDAGLSWSRALDGAHLYEFGNKGAVLVAVDDEESTDVLQYSLDHGKTWAKAALDKKIRAKFLTTAPDSTTLKFLLMGTHGTGSKSEWHVYKVDFDGLHERSCSDKDFERWPARVDADGKATCIMGHRQFFRRRKADAACVVGGEFQDPQPEFEACAPEGACKDDGQGTFKGPSGYRLIPGNQCIRKGGVELDKPIDRPCSETVRKPVSGEIGVEKTTFAADMFAEWYYLESGGNLKEGDETIVMRTSEQDIFLSRDHGKSWTTILAGEPITAIVPNPNNHDIVYFLTDSKKVHYTFDRGERFSTFAAPERPSSLRLPPLYLPTLKFHPTYKDWLLWSGSVGQDDHTNVFYSRDRGDDWGTLVRYARRCDFIPKEGSGQAGQLIYCEQYEDENPEKKLMLLSSDNFFADSTVHFDDILDFATMSEFIIVAAKTEDRQGLKVDASVDGHVFAAAEFPRNFQVAHQQAYTVLDSSTHAVFLHVTVNAARDHEYGTIIKSNSNGTSYKMQGLEGVALANVVSNAEAALGGQKKILKSMITHNDGAEWALIPPPKLDAVGNAYACVARDQKPTDKCSLHLHSYTERRDKSATFSSASAVGLMMAVGNVGDRLLRKDDEDTWTFVTRDAGISWKSVKRGSYMWEYGDQGSIIVIVPESLPTRSVFYTLNEGDTWTEFVFSPDQDMQIDAITTLPSDRSMNFLLWGKELGSSSSSSSSAAAAAMGGAIVTVNLDFSTLTERQRLCHLDEENPVNVDYELWEPKHPMQDGNCLFGHVSQFHRKRLDAECRNGKNTIEQLHNITRNCECTRQDYECDYNYQVQADGTCRLVDGQSPPDHAENCRENPDQIEFWYPTGYRKIPLSTCSGGTSELDKIKSQPCPGHEREYNDKHGLSGAGLFFAIAIPICVAAGVGYWAVQQWRSGSLAGFGQIRLGEAASRESAQSALLTVPVAILSAVVAVAKATPLLLMSLWRSASGYLPVSGGGAGQGRFASGSSRPYRSRDAFASRQQDYSQVVEDDAMLGDTFDEDGEEVEPMFEDYSQQGCYVFQPSATSLASNHNNSGNNDGNDDGNDDDIDDGNGDDIDDGNGDDIDDGNGEDIDDANDDNIDNDIGNDIDGRPRKRQKTQHPAPAETKDRKGMPKPKPNRRADLWPRLCAGTEPVELAALRHKTYRRLWRETEECIDAVIDAVDRHALAKIRHFVRSACPNLPTALKALIRLAIDGHHDSPSPDHYAAFVAAHKRLIPMPFDLELLQRYLGQHGLSRVVLALPEIESFDVSLVADLVHHLSLWSDRIPFSLVLGISTTIDLFEARLPKATIRLLHAQPFSLSPHADPLYPILQATHHPSSTRLCLGPSVLAFLAESSHNQSTTPLALKRIIKYAFMSHFFANPLSALLCHEAEHATLHNPTNQSFLASLLRNTPSFRAHCSDLLHLNTKDAAERVRQLLTSDADTLDHAISSLTASAAHLGSAYTAVDAFVQLYTNPALNLNSPPTPPSELYVQLSQHLLPGPKTKAIQSNRLHSDLMSALSLLPATQISDIVNGLSTLQATSTAASITHIQALFSNICPPPAAQHPSSPVHLLEICTFALRHPLQATFAPRPRHAIERALSRPSDYLGCDCCVDDDHRTAIRGRSTPSKDIGKNKDKEPTSLLYTLLCEAGKHVNTRDFLFYRALAELKMLGLVQQASSSSLPSIGTTAAAAAASSSRAASSARVDIIARSTWMGL